MDADEFIESLGEQAAATENMADLARGIGRFYLTLRELGVGEVSAVQLSEAALDRILASALKGGEE